MNFDLKLPISIACLILLLLQLGCGDTSVDDRAPEVDPDQIKIGLLVPITGPLAGVGQDMEATARMAAQEINNSGGVNGKEIGFLVRDSRLGLEGAAETSNLMVQQLVDEGVVSLIGPAGSGTTVSITEKLVENGLPMISPSATSASLTSLDDHDLVWRTVASDAFQGNFLANQLILDDKQSIAIIFRDDAYGRSLNEVITDKFSEMGGVVLANVAYPADQSDNFDEEVVALFDSGMPDAVVIVSFLIDGANIGVSLANLNLSNQIQLYGVDGVNRQEFIDNAPAQLILGMRGTAPTAPINSPNYVAFSSAYEHLFNKQTEIFLDSLYDAVYVTALAMSVAGENTSVAIKNNLRSVSRADSDSPVQIDVGPSGYQTALENLERDLDLNGAAGAIDFDINGDVSSGHYIFWEIVEVDGELVFQTLSESTFP